MKKYICAFFLLFIVFSSCKKRDGNTCPAGDCEQNFLVITDSEAAFNPAGTDIVYIHNDMDQSKRGIYLIKANGEENRLFHQGYAANPSFSLDGKWVLFSQNNKIYKKQISDGNIVTIVNETGNHFPSWSPDNKWISYESYNQSPNGRYFIWKINSTDLIPQRIAYDPINVETKMPFWGTNNKILHIRNLSLGVGKSDIFSMDPDGNNVKQLTNNDAIESYPQSSVNGEIVCDLTQNGIFTSIWKMDMNGQNQKQLVKTASTRASWSPDGKQIVYTDSKTTGRLWLMDSNGNTLKQLTSDKNF